MIYVLYGLDNYLINYNVKKIVKGDDKEYFDLENTDLGSIILSCNSLSLFSNHKNIVVENSYIFTSTINKKLPEQNIDVLDKYIDNINKDVNLIFVIEKDKLDDRKKIVKKIKEKGKIIDCNTKKNNISIVKEFFDRYKISDEDIKYLIDRVGDNLSIIYQESEKLKIYKIDDKVIDKNDIDMITTKAYDLDIFHLIENIVLKNKEKALESYNELIKNGEEPIKIIILLSNQFRLIFQSKKLYMMGYSELNISQKLKVHPYAIKKALEKTRNFKEEKLIDYLYKLAILDENIKKGKIDANTGLELFIINL